jgi:hypothetical protein
MKKQSTRNALMVIAMIVTLGLVYWVSKQEQETDDGSLPLAPRTTRIPASHHMDSVASATDSPTQLNWRLLDDRNRGLEGEHKPVDLFKTHSWYIAPVQTLAKNLPPSQPSAPAAPFSYLGHMEGTAQGTLVFLTSGGKLYTVAAGSNIDKVWRLDSEDVNFLRLTYLPLNLPQIISKTSKSPGANQPIVPEQQQGTSS